MAIAVVKINGTTMSNIKNETIEIKRPINRPPTVEIKVQDKNFSLFNTEADTDSGVPFKWKDCQHKPITIEDAFGRILFSGRIEDPDFKNNLMTLKCEGNSAKAGDKTITPGRDNYVLFSGRIKTVNYLGDEDRLLLNDDDGVALVMGVDSLHENDRDTGIVVTNDTDLLTATWSATSSDLTGVDSSDGVIGNMDDKDELNYTINDEDGPNYDLDARFNFGVNGDKVPAGSTLVSIKISWRVNHTNTNVTACKLEVDRDSGSKIFLTNISQLFGFTEGNIIFNKASYDLTDFFHESGDGYFDLKLRISIVDTFDAGTTAACIFDYLNVEVTYDTVAFSPIQAKVTDNGVADIIADAADFVAAGVNGESGPGVNDGDIFRIGESGTTILQEVFSVIEGLSIDVDDTFSIYFPRSFAGMNPFEILDSIRLAEGALWYEVPISNDLSTIFVRKISNLETSDFSGIPKSISQANHDWDKDIQRKSNQYKHVRVMGNPNSAIDILITDGTASNTSTLEWVIIDASIANIPDATEMGQAQLDIKKVVRPSYIVNVTDTNEDVVKLDAGTEVSAAFTYPTIGAATYPIRASNLKISYPLGKIINEVHLGLGETQTLEDLALKIKRIHEIAWSSKYTAQNPNIVIGTPAFSHTALSNRTSSSHHIKTVAGDLDHDDINLPNGNAEEQHMTSAQIAALHATYTDAEAVAAVAAGFPIMPFIVFPSGGFALAEVGELVIAVTDSDADAAVLTKSFCSVTGTYKVVIISHNNGGGGITNSGLILVGGGTAGEGRSANNKINSANMDLVHVVADQYLETKSAAFTLDAGDNVKIRWKKDAAEAGDLLSIDLIYLELQ